MKFNGRVTRHGMHQGCPKELKVERSHKEGKTAIKTSNFYTVGAKKEICTEGTRPNYRVYR